jgi:hypothetical protein
MSYSDMGRIVEGCDALALVYALEDGAERDVPLDRKR